MTTISQPKVNVAIASAVTEVSNDQQRVLFVGQMIAGTATPDTLVTNIQSDGEWDDLFGEDSMLAAMIRNARVLNNVSRFDAIPLSDAGGGVNAIKTIEFTGNAGADGSYTITVGSKQNHTVTVAIAENDNPGIIAAAVKTALDLNSNLPFSVTVSFGQTILTALNAGTYGEMGIDVSGTVENVTFTVATTTAGTVDPTLTDTLSVIDNIRYQTIVWPYPSTAQLVPLTTELESRFNSAIGVLDGVGITAATDTSSNLVTTYDTENSQSLVVLGDTDTSLAGAFLDVPSVFEIAAVKASQISAIRALRRTEGASIAQFLAGEAGLDAFGGAALSSRPYFNTPLPTIPLSTVTDGFTASQVENLFDAGVTVIGNNSALTGVILGETVTTYKTDTAGNDDLSFKFLNFVDTASSAREFIVDNLQVRFAQSRLTEGDLVPGRPMANAQLILSTLVEFYNTLSGPEFALTQAGETARNTFISNTTVTLDLVTGVVTVLMGAVPLVTQLRVINATMTISFSANG